MKHNKLVRDRISEIIKSKGGTPVTHIAGDEEYWQKLKEKLREEVDEFDKSENIEELADIFEVVNAICDYKGFDKDALEIIRKGKAAERGEFKERIILEENQPD